MRRLPSGHRTLSQYRSGRLPTPTASMDLRILAAARDARAKSPGRDQLVFVGAMAATVLVAFTARWFIPDPRLATQDFGIAEGQSRDYLLKFDPLISGPGSQEGLP